MELSMVLDTNGVNRTNHIAIQHGLLYWEVYYVLHNHYPYSICYIRYIHAR